MNTEEKNKIYEKAISTYGKKAQLEMLQEEAIEVALAARKFIRHNWISEFKELDEETKLNLIEEIGDIENMIAQFEYMFEDDNKSIRKAIDEQKEFKLNRLSKKLI